MLAIEKLRVINKNIYNFNKKSFLINISIALIQVMTHKKLKSDKIIGASQDNNKD